MTREEAIVQLRLGPGINEDVSEKYNDAVDMAIEALQDRPTGKWIIKYGAHSDVLVKECYCDQCGKRGGLATMLFDDRPLPNFCGHCGADMRGLNDETHKEKTK